MRKCVVLICCLCILFSCKSDVKQTEVEKELDPWLVEKLGPDYEQYINEGIPILESDTIVQLAFSDSIFLFSSEKWRKRFVLKIPYENIGSNPSKFYQSWSSCECIDNEPQKDFLIPGETDELTLTFDPRKWEIGQRHSFWVVSEHFPHYNQLIIERK